MSNLADFLHRSADVYPDKTAIVCGEARISFQHLRDAASSIATGLQTMGIGPGDTVALSCPNIPQFLMIYYGILITGAAVVPLNILLKPKEIAYHLKDSNASVYFCFEGTQELPIGHNGLEAFQATDSCESFIAITIDAQASSWEEHSTLAHLLVHPSTVPAIVCPPSSNAAILYTSGTTGQPKGAELTHHNLAMNTLSCIGLAKTDSRDTHLVVLPLFHSFCSNSSDASRYSHWLNNGITNSL